MPLGGKAPVLCGNNTDSIGCPGGFYCRTGPPDVCCPGQDPARTGKRIIINYAIFAIEPLRNIHEIVHGILFLKVVNWLMMV